MRTTIFAVVPCVVVIAGVLFGACGGDDTSTGGSCQGSLQAGPCFDCVMNSCCDALKTCFAEEAGCRDCIAGNKSACASDAWHTLFQCGDTNCHDACTANQDPHPDCTAPETSTTGGKCVTLSAKMTCNPITNEKCDAAAQQVCDYNPGTDSFQCFSPPPANDGMLCDTCGPNEGFCAAGKACRQFVSLASDGVGIHAQCARACCDDTDCGPTGFCETALVAGETIGTCTAKPGATGGAGGTGGGAAGSGGATGGTGGA